MTMSELLSMARGRQEHDWGIASGLMAMMANTAFGSEGGFSSDDFNPIVERIEKLDDAGLGAAMAALGSSGAIRIRSENGQC